MTKSQQDAMMEKALTDIAKMFGRKPGQPRTSAPLFDGLVRAWGDALDNPSPTMKVVEIKQEVK